MFPLMKLKLREIFWVLVIFYIKETLSLKGLKITVPEVVKSGDTVTLSCEYDLEQVALYSINWYWNGQEFYRYLPKESPPYRDFLVQHFDIDLSRSGANQVTLRNIRPESSGNYECEVSCDAPLFQTGHESAHMTIVELTPDDPVMYVNPERVEIGSRVKAECSTPGSNPPANITWFINDEQMYEDNESVKIHPYRHEDINISSSSFLLRRTKSKIDVVTNRSQFSNGIMLIKCEAIIFDLWKSSVEFSVIELITQQLTAVPALGSISSHQQSQSDTEKAIMVNKTADLKVSLIIIILMMIHFFVQFER